MTIPNNHPLPTLRGVKEAASRMKAAGFNASDVELGFHVALAYIIFTVADALESAPCVAARNENVSVIQMAIEVGDSVSGRKFEMLAAALADEKFH